MMDEPRKIGVIMGREPVVLTTADEIQFNRDAGIDVEIYFHADHIIDAINRRITKCDGGDIAATHENAPLVDMLLEMEAEKMEDEPIKTSPIPSRIANATIQKIPESISLRDWFAGMALQGMLASENYEGSRYSFDRYDAEAAYKAADAMMKEREK